MAKIALKDTPDIPRSKLVTSVVGDSSITQLAVQDGNPVAMEYTGADPGTGKATVFVRVVPNVAGTYSNASVTVDRFGRIIEIKSGDAPVVSLDWGQINNKPEFYKTKWDMIEGTPPVFEVKVLWNDVEQKPTTLDGFGLLNEVNQLIAAALQGFHPDWDKIGNRPTTLQGFGLLTEVNKIIADALKGVKRDESFFYPGQPALKDTLLYAKLFGQPASLDLGSKLAQALIAPSALTSVDVFKGNTRIATATFDVQGKVSWGNVAQTAEFNTGDLLRAKLVTEPNGIGNIAMTFTAAYFAGGGTPDPVDPSQPPGPVVIPPNNVQHSIPTVDAAYVWLMTPTSNSVANLLASSAKALVAPTSAATFDVELNGSKVGSLAFSAGSTTGVFSGGNVDVSRGDILAIKCLTFGGLQGLVLYVALTGTTQFINLLAGSCDKATKTEVFRYLALNSFTLDAAVSSAVAAQHDATVATVFNIRNNDTIIGTVTYAAGSNTGVVALSAPAVVAGNVITIDSANTSNLAGVAINLAGNGANGAAQSKTFSASYVGNAPELQMLSGLLVGDPATIDFAQSKATLLTAATHTFVLALFRNGAEVATITFAQGSKVGVFNRTDTLAVVVGDTLVEYAKTGTADRPAVTFALV